MVQALQSKEEMERRNERVKRRKSFKQSHLNKSQNKRWAQNRVSVRNYTATAARDPAREVAALFARLAITVASEDFRIDKCVELVAGNGLYQIIIEFARAETKIELLAKFPILQGHENPEVRQLRIVDPLEVSQLYKRVNAKLRVKNGAAATKLTNNQILVKMKAKDEFCEVTSVEQLEALADQIPSCSNNNLTVNPEV